MSISNQANPFQQHLLELASSSTMHPMSCSTSPRVPCRFPEFTHLSSYFRYRFECLNFTWKSATSQINRHDANCWTDSFTGERLIFLAIALKDYSLTYR